MSKIIEIELMNRIEIEIIARMVIVLRMRITIIEIKNRNEIKMMVINSF